MIPIIEAPARECAGPFNGLGRGLTLESHDPVTRLAAENVLPYRR